VNKHLESGLLKQLNREFHSAYIYLGMSSYCTDKDLNGFANWLFVQYEEEQVHAMKIYKYLLQRGVTVELDSISKPVSDFSSILDLFKKALAHEEFMTLSFNELSDVAMEHRDHATYNFLQWFVNEQVEEESIFKEIISKIERVELNSQALYMLDRELENRTLEVQA
jgi:ferritin